MLFSLHHSDHGLLPNLKHVQLFVLSAFFMGSLIILFLATASGDEFLMREAIAVCATSALSYVLGRKGYAGQALGFLLCVVAGCAFTSCYLFRGINDVGASLIPVLLLLAGLLLNRRFLFSYATAVILGAIGVMAGRWWVTRLAFDPSEARDLFLFVLICALSAAVTLQLSEHIAQNYRLIRESEERFRQVAESAGEFIWEVDANGLYLYASPVVRQILGYTPDEVVGRMHFYDLFAPETREETKTAAFEVFARREEFRAFPNFNVTKDGRVVALETSGLPILDGNGNLLGYRGADTDVTERRQAEEALRENKERLVSIYNTVEDAVFHLAVEPEGQFRFVSVNAAFLRVTGLSLEKVAGKTVNEIIPEPSLTMVLGKYRQAIEENTIVRWEETSDYPPGRMTGEVSVAPVFDSKGTCTHLVGSVHDITGRTRAEEALRRSEERFRSLFENATVGLYRTTPAGRIEMANPALVRMLGYESFAALARRNLEESGFEPEYPRSAFRKTLEQEGQIHGLEAAWTRSDGSVVFVRESARCVKDEAGAVRFYEGIVEDVTQRKRTEDALRRSEQKFAAAFRLGPAAMSIVDTEDGDCILDINEGFEQVSGYSRVELVGRRAPKLGIWSEPEEYSQAQKRFGTDGRLRNFEFHFRRKSGEIRTGLVSAEPMEINNRRCAITCTTDLTERKRAEGILAASEAKYRALVETTDTGYLILDKEGKVIDANREYVRLTSHSELGEILGRSVIEWTAAHDKQKIAEAVARCVKDGFIRDLVIDYVDGENRVTPVDINAKVTGDGESLRIISLCRDITEHKRAEEVRLQLQLAQVQKMESIGRLAGGVAHDFNNLLTVINGYAAFLSEQLEISDPLRGYALEIGEAGRRAASLTSQLLAFSRKRAIVPRAINLNAVVADAERMLQRLIGEDIELVSSLAPRLGLVMADPDQIHQIIMNLAVNARDAMPNGGKFEITTAEVELDETAADAHPDAALGRYVQLTVKDTGMGMTEEVRQKIFEPFFTTKEQGQGTGLGLAIVYGAVRQHDGWIEVKSEPGRGSTFRIHLPCIDAGVAVDEAKPAAANALHGDETVLVVEDEEAVRRLTKTILEAHGYRVLEADSGAEAHAVASRRAGEIDLLLTDVVMPGMSGPQLAERLQPLHPQMKVLYMSGYPEPRQPNSALVSEVDFIQKPFTKQKLLRRLREVLEGGKLSI